MSIDRIEHNNFIQSPLTPAQIPTRQAEPVVCDGYASGTSPITNKQDCLRELSQVIQNAETAQPAETQSSKQAEEVSDKQNKSAEFRFVFRITADGIKPLKPNADGGFLVDEETGTTAYYGKTAKQFLAKNTQFDRETEIAVPRGGTMEISTEKQGFMISGASAALLGKGAQAKVVVKDANPLVIQNERSPGWYQKLGPNGEISREFDKLVERNQFLIRCITQKNRFNEADLRKLLDFGIVSNDSADPNSVRWDPSVKTPDALEAKLVEAGFRGQAIEDNRQIWYDTIKRQLYRDIVGQASITDFNPDQLQKLQSGQIARMSSFDKNHIFWNDFLNERQLREKLTASGLRGNDAEAVVAVWKRTTKSGYDNTGLVWDNGKVVAYDLNEKLNMWNEQHTEWMINSTSFAGENEPFTVGVSHVRAKKPYDKPIDFHDIRPAENLHRHPIRDGHKRQTEAYLITGGRGAILTMKKVEPEEAQYYNQKGETWLFGKRYDSSSFEKFGVVQVRNPETGETEWMRPEIVYLEPGDMAVLDPGVPHCVLAADGDYEHLCFQIPSTFQYGFMFKEELPHEDFGTTRENALKEALSFLQNSKN